jgi:ArsR family transcriptional regulator, arsenate/arsenite/antimonite-responsive transcriptional repressor
MELIQVIKALSDETRIRILNLLNEGDLCVCELESLLDLNQSNASRHLNKLTNAKLVEYYKKAKYVYYTLVEDTLKEYPFIKELLNNELCKIEQCNYDMEELKKYKNSGISCDNLKQKKVANI